MNNEATHALRAARMVRRCGRFAARQYAVKHGVSLAAYRLARVLLASEEVPHAAH